MRLPVLGEAPAPCGRPYLPTVEAVERLWDEVDGENLWAPKHFWKYLRLRRRLRLRQLDTERVRVTAPRFKLNDCRSCTDICCVGPSATVLLRLVDIATLVDIGRADLIVHDKPSFSDPELSARVALRRQVESESWATFPVLRRDKLGACAALTHAGKCSLYPHWPLACARFPYALRETSGEAFYSQRCDAFWVRPDAGVAVAQMVRAAVLAYNHRVRDALLLTFRRSALADLGLLDYLRLRE